MNPRGVCRIVEDDHDIRDWLRLIPTKPFRPRQLYELVDRLCPAEPPLRQGQDRRGARQS